MAEYCIGSAVGAVSARNTGATVHAVAGEPGRWAPAACGAYVKVSSDPWAHGVHERCPVCLSRAPLGRAD
jgi:hypothetical protein